MNKDFTLEIPVVYCTFNRLDCTKQSFERIKNNKPQKLYLVSDGPRSHVEGEKEKVEEVRNYIMENIDWDCEVHTNFAEENMGCGKRMSSGITWAFDHEKWAIIIEDDCLVNTSFFRFCQELLIRYENNDQIGVISGYRTIVGEETTYSYFFSGFAEIWGWATWKRVWEKYDFDMKQWKNRKITKHMKEMMNKTAQESYRCLFDWVYNHQLDTWDYQLQYQVFMNEWLAVKPRQSMVQNVGFGDDATHTMDLPEEIVTDRSWEMEFPLKHPDKIERNTEYDKKYVAVQWKIDLITFIKMNIKACINYFRRRFL